MGDDVVVRIAAETDIVEARKAGRELAAAQGFTQIELTLIATAVSEVARNIVKYAQHGEILFRTAHKDARAGITIIARDQGPGIANIEEAMRDGFSTGEGLGLGLPGARRLMDDFSLDSVEGKGTTVTMTKWT